eukprot:scaffold94705_cov38-Attheya_sp.AAC.1
MGLRRWGLLQSQAILFPLRGRVNNKNQNQVTDLRTAGISLTVWAKTHRELADVAVDSVMWHLSESAPMCVTNSVTHIGIW